MQEMKECVNFSLKAILMIMLYWNFKMPVKCIKQELEFPNHSKWLQ